MFRGLSLDGDWCRAGHKLQTGNWSLMTLHRCLYFGTTTTDVTVDGFDVALVCHRSCLLFSAKNGNLSHFHFTYGYVLDTRMYPLKSVAYVSMSVCLSVSQSVIQSQKFSYFLARVFFLAFLYKARQKKARNCYVRLTYSFVFLISYSSNLG